MAKTQSDLITAVLNELNRIGAGQTALAEDTAVLTPELQPIIDELIDRRVASTFTLSAIPTTIYRSLVRLCALHLGPLFGKVVEPAAFQQLLTAEEERLRQLSRLDRTAPPLVLKVLEQLEIYQASSDTLDATAISSRLPEILAELAQRQVVYFPDVDSVPDAAVPDLSRYVAASLASPPLYSVMSMAETRLRSLNNSTVPSRPVRAVYF